MLFFWMPMGDPGDFKRILDETTLLIARSKDSADQAELEELEMRIKSNIHALKIIGSKISDEEMRKRAQDALESFASGVKLEMRESTQTRKRRDVDKRDRSEVDMEILKGAQELRKMAEHFGSSIERDKRVIEEISERMGKENVGTRENLKIVRQSEKGIGSTRIIFLAFLLFLCTYFVIRIF